MEFDWIAGYRKPGVVNNNVEAFLGIPYAAPPVGALRYLPPASSGPWTGIRQATTLPPACPQQMPNLSNRYVINNKRSLIQNAFWIGYSYEIPMK